MKRTTLLATAGGIVLLAALLARTATDHGPADEAESTDVQES